MPIANFTSEGEKVFQRRTQGPSFTEPILIQHIAKGVEMLRGEKSPNRAKGIQTQRREMLRDPLTLQQNCGPGCAMKTQRSAEVKVGREQDARLRSTGFIS